MESDEWQVGARKACENIFRGVGITQSVQGMFKNDFRTCFENLFFTESQIHVRSGDLKGSKLIRKTRFEVLRISQSTQGMCRNDPRTSLEKVIFWSFHYFWHLVSDPGQILGFSRFWRLRGRNRPRYEHVGGPVRSNRPQNPSKGCLGQLFPEY